MAHTTQARRILRKMLVANKRIKGGDCVCFKRKREIGKIYETTDGYLSNNPNNTKKRKVTIIAQRQIDNAVAVSKLTKADGKTGDYYVNGLLLKPKRHKSLTQNTLVERRVLIGIKQKDGTFKPISKRDMKFANDRLTFSERRKLKRGVGGRTKENRKSYKNKMKKWTRGFK